MAWDQRRSVPSPVIVGGIVSTTLFNLLLPLAYPYFAGKDEAV
jgi:hypothetical protein